MSLQPRIEQWLAKQCFWDEEDQLLWIDCRKVLPEYGVLSVPSWDQMMMQPGEIPDYPPALRVLSWSQFSQLSYWKKQIPGWVTDSCALFPSHQLKLLHFVGRYPQLLELLDHSPILAWRLVVSDLSEAEIVELLGHKRTEMAISVGWPGKTETIEFLRKLRLRQVNSDIADMVDVCVLDDQRLSALKQLPRINSMALTLAAHFPRLIGSQLHQSLAQMPCRPIQCKGMMALLEDVYRLAEHLAITETELRKIGEARYLVEVEKIYQAWWFCDSLQVNSDLMLTDHPQVLRTVDQWSALSCRQKHYWLTETEKLASGQYQLVAWKEAGILIAAMLDSRTQKVLRARQSDNQLPDANQLSQLYCYLAKQPI